MLQEYKVAALGIVTIENGKIVCTEIYGELTTGVVAPQSRNGYVILMNGDNAIQVLEQLTSQMYLGAELWQRK